MAGYLEDPEQYNAYDPQAHLTQLPGTYQQGTGYPIGGFNPPPQPPTFRETYRASKPLDARRMMWAGLLSDIGSHIGSGGRTPMQGLGMQMFNQATQYNNDLDERNAERQWRQQQASQAEAYRQQQMALQRERFGWQQDQANLPAYHKMGNQLLATTPGGETTVQYEGAGTPDKPQIFGNAQSGFFRLGPDGNAVPLVDPVVDPGEDTSFKDANTLRDDYFREVKDYNPQVDLWNNMQEVIQPYYGRPDGVTDTQHEQNKAGADQSLIFGLMKARDPSSTVAAGEYATASNATGVDGQMRNMYNKILSGESLTDEQRKAYIREMQIAGNRASKGIQDVQARYGEMAGRYGLNAQDMFGAYEAAANPALDRWMSPPPAGEVIDLGFD